MRATSTVAGEFSSTNRVLAYSTPSAIKASLTTAAAAAETARPAPSQAIPREHAYRLCAVLMAGDWFFSWLAIFAGLELREWQRMDWASGFWGQVHVRSMPVFWSLCGSALFSWLMVMLKSYEVENLYRMQKWTKNLLKSVLLWSIAIWACIGLFRITDFSPRVGVAYCMATLVTFIGFWRLSSFVFLMHPRVKGAASSRVIVVGWNEKAAHLRQVMRRDMAQLGEIIGCIPMPGGHFAAKPPTELAVLGDYSALPQVVAECRASSIILADVSCPALEILHLIKFCQREMIDFQMVPEYFPALNSGLQVQTVSGVPLLSVSQLPLDRTLNRGLKRLIDIAGAIVGLCLFSPIIMLFSALVYLESPGPVIYRQRRTSRSGQTFIIFKIRSMKINAESASGAVWCKQEDPRRLRIGAFMRKYNVDELPQFWNVLMGDMSLVGPRPERPELIEKFKDEIPNYNARHEVRTGLTGWAQIQGLRGDTDLGKRVEADLYYLENWSLMLDLYCIAATFFKNKNAH
jgi:exopolysaccharide biosynthesis polyprenyl glycosylphosphotransferase